jgi:hypothetical protein
LALSSFDQHFYIADKVGHENAQFLDLGFLHLEESLVFGQIALLVSGVENPPAICRPPDGVGETLKDRESVLASVSMPPQGRQCGRMRGSVFN